MGAKKQIEPWMKRDVVSIKPTATLREAANLLAEKRVGTLPVVDESGKLIGLTTMREIVSMFLPDFLSLVENVDFVKDYGALDDLSPEDIEKANSLTVGEIMEEPVSIDDSCSLVRALSVMSRHSMADMPVVRDDKLVGIVSRVDIGRAFLESWLAKEGAKSK